MYPQLGTPIVPPLSPEHREAVRQSNYRRAEQTRQMNKNRVWDPEMVEKLRATKLAQAYGRKLRQVEELGLGHNIYKIRTDASGYTKVGVVDHPHYGTMCSVSLHRVILSERIGRRPTPEEHGHHLDEDKSNIEDDNIEMLAVSEHMRLHATGRVASPERRAQVSAQFKGKKLSPEHRAKIGRPKTDAQKAEQSARLKRVGAEKRAAGTHKRGPDSEEVKARKKAAAQAAWDKRRAAGPVKFRPRTQEEKDSQSIKASEMWERRRAAKAD